MVSSSLFVLHTLVAVTSVLAQSSPLEACLEGAGVRTIVKTDSTWYVYWFLIEPDPPFPSEFALYSWTWNFNLAITHPSCNTLKLMLPFQDRRNYTMASTPKSQPFGSSLPSKRHSSRIINRLCQRGWH